MTRVTISLRFTVCKYYKNIWNIWTNESDISFSGIITMILLWAQMSFSFPSLIYDQQSKSRNNLRNLELFRNLFLSRQLPITFKKKKEKMIPNLLRRPLEQRVPYQNERNDPLESPILSFFLSRGSEKKRDAQNRGERERERARESYETPLVRIAFQAGLVHLVRSKRWHPPTLRSNQTRRERTRVRGRGATMGLWFFLAEDRRLGVKHRSLEWEEKTGVTSSRVKQSFNTRFGLGLGKTRSRTRA